MEIFGPTIQGEGLYAGKRTHFIRLGGCGYRCSWCDSMHAVDPKLVKKNARKMVPADIVSELQALEHIGHSAWVTISGGDPTMHNLEDLIVHLRAAGLKIAIETQGQFYRKWMASCDLITVSPKPPSSGMADKLDMDELKQILTFCNAYLKLVIFGKEDLLWATDLHCALGHITQTFLSVGTRQNLRPSGQIHIVEEICDDLKQLYDAVLELDDLHNVTVLPQLHVLAWGHEKEK